MTVENIPAVTLAFARPLEKLKFLVSPVIPFLHGLAQNSLRKNLPSLRIAGTSVSQCVTVHLVKVNSTEMKFVPLTGNPANTHMDRAGLNSQLHTTCRFYL